MTDLREGLVGGLSASDISCLPPAIGPSPGRSRWDTGKPVVIFAGSCNALTLASAASAVSKRGNCAGESKSMRSDSVGTGIFIGDEGKGTKLASSSPAASSAASLPSAASEGIVSSAANVSGPLALFAVALTLPLLPKTLEILPRLILILLERCGRCERSDETADLVTKVCLRLGCWFGFSVAFSLVAVSVLRRGRSGLLPSWTVLLFYHQHI